MRGGLDQTAFLLILAVMSAGCAATGGESKDEVYPPGEPSDIGASAAPLTEVWAQVRWTSGDGLNVRSGPTTSYPVVDWLPEWTWVRITCQTTGTTVGTNNEWDYLPDYGGYVTDYYMDTGYASWIPGLPNCSSPPGGGSLTVRGHTLTAAQDHWIRYVASDVLPEMRGTRDARLDHAALVAWWSLKEGILDYTPNPNAFSNCNYGPGDDRRIGPLAVCPDPDHAWQVGLAGVQAAWRDLADVEALAQSVHPTRSLQSTLGAAADAAGYPAGTSTYDSIVWSTGRLRLSWLLRDAAVGFEAQYPDVHYQCFVACDRGWELECSWCFGTGWDTSAAFAPNQSAALAAIADIRAILDDLS